MGVKRQGRTDIGILVGWKHQHMPDSIVLQLQNVDPGATREERNFNTLDLLMTKSQAMVLANYLAKVASGELASPKRSIWSRIFNKSEGGIAQVRDRYQ